MEKKATLYKIIYFFLTKMIVSAGIIVSLVALIEWLRSSILDKAGISDNSKALIVSVLEALVAVAGYIFIFRAYEKRRIQELSAAAFRDASLMGFLTGIGLQGLFILIIYLSGGYLIYHINPVSVLVGPLAFAVTAGFVAEIIMIGILFRILEEQTGTINAVILFIILFAVLHINIQGATVVSVGATAMQAGLLLPAAYVFSRNLWLPIFIHLGWDFAEPGIFGGINPSGSMTKGLLASKISGNSLITGGQTGPQDSLSSLLLCLLLGLVFLYLAKRRNKMIQPLWRRQSLAKG